MSSLKLRSSHVAEDPAAERHSCDEWRQAVVLECEFACENRTTMEKKVKEDLLAEELVGDACEASKLLKVCGSVCRRCLSKRKQIGHPSSMPIEAVVLCRSSPPIIWHAFMHTSEC